MPKIKYERPSLYKKQEDAIFCDARYGVIEASVQSGKTVGCLCWIWEKALVGGKEGRNYWWVAPTFEQADIAFRRLKQFAPDGLWEDNKARKSLTLINGAMIWFKSADKPDSLYGESVYAAVIDEATRCKQESWHAVRSRVAATGGPLRIIGNVKGRKNWAYKLARKAEQAPEDDDMYHYAKITAIDAVKAGVLPPEEIAQAREMYPENVFRELYLAEPGDDEGNPFGIQHIQECILKGPTGNKTSKPADGRPVSWGWDVAKSDNYTVGIGLNRDGEVCRFERWRGGSWEATIHRIINNTKGVRALVDSTTTGGGQQIEALRREGGHNFRGYKFTTNSKQDLMLGLAMAIQRREIKFPDGPIVQELEAFEYERKRDKVLYSAPDGTNDDCVDALALAVKNWSRDTQFNASAAPIERTRTAPFKIT